MQTNRYKRRNYGLSPHRQPPPAGQQRLPDELGDRRPFAPVMTKVGVNPSPDPVTRVDRPAPVWSSAGAGQVRAPSGGPADNSPVRGAVALPGSTAPTAGQQSPVSSAFAAAPAPLQLLQPPREADALITPSMLSVAQQITAGISGSVQSSCRGISNWVMSRRPVAIGGGVSLVVIGVTITAMTMLSPPAASSRLKQLGGSVAGAMSVSSGNEQSSLAISAPKSDTLVSSVNTSVSSVPPATLAFTPVVPPDQPQLAKLGPKAYDSKHGTYTFDNLYLAKPVRVSEQTLPTGYASTDDLLQQVAAAKQLTDAFTVVAGANAYLGTNTANGVQTVVFSTKGLLVFAQSTFNFTANQWAAYLQSLQ